MRNLQPDRSLPGHTDDRSNPLRLLASLYDAIAGRDYPRAYGYWEQPPSGMSETQFANGYADTVSVLVAVRPPLRYDGAAGSQYAALPEHFVTAQDLTPAEHVRMQAAVQRHVDSAISKTVNLPSAGVEYQLPFGGTKDSSFGPKEQGPAAMPSAITVSTALTRCWRN